MDPIQQAVQQALSQQLQPIVQAMADKVAYQASLTAKDEVDRQFRNYAIGAVAVFAAGFLAARFLGDK